MVRENGYTVSPGTNPWRELFKYAEKNAGHTSEIVPYWVFPIKDGAYIERHALTLPLSREAARLPALRSSLAVYRMVFGQPRQEDLLEHLKRTVAPADLAKLSHELYVNLEPRGTE